MTSSSFPFMTAACMTLIVMNLATFPVGYIWKKMFPSFQDLSKHTRRHDVNLLMRAITGPLLAVPIIYTTANTFQDFQWFLNNQTFISYWFLAFLLVDLFDLSQRRKFDWQSYIHHIFQTVYALYLLEWGDIYKYGFPSLGIAIFSLLGRPALVIFPLRRVVKDPAITVQSARVLFWNIVLAGAGGFALMLGLIVKYQDRLPFILKVAQPVAYIVFQLLDVSYYMFIYKIAYPKQKQVEATAAQDEEVGIKEGS